MSECEVHCVVDRENHDVPQKSKERYYATFLASMTESELDRLAVMKANMKWNQSVAGTKHIVVHVCQGQK